jgi:hypothetical protein
MSSLLLIGCLVVVLAATFAALALGIKIGYRLGTSAAAIAAASGQLPGDGTLISRLCGEPTAVVIEQDRTE